MQASGSLCSQPRRTSRWHDLFAYAQAKTELNRPAWLARPYLSLRFVGDTHGAVEPGIGFAPQYLSENAVIAALGVATRTWHGAAGWFEAGEQLRYRPTSTDPSFMSPDYRGGVSYAKGVGHLLTQGSHGLFAETNDDAVYVRRFENDTLFYSQNRTGYTLRQAETGFAGFAPAVVLELQRNHRCEAPLLGELYRDRPGPALSPRRSRRAVVVFGESAQGRLPGERGQSARADFQ